MPRAMRLESMIADEKLPALELVDLAFGLEAAHLLVERVEQLLSGGGAGKRRAMVERAAEAAKIQ